MSVPEPDAKSIFGEALRLTDPGERNAYLETACGASETLRQEVESLLQAHAQAGAFLDNPVQLPTPVGPTERAGSKIGRYKLLEQIGEGGFGTVWMAEQEEPVRRRVALKIIKLGMDTREVVARFEAERQALAMMDHPHIASVFDGGATDTGRPYFVMELVKGVPITDYCDANRLPTRERLELFMQVCQAVQHAHQKGIIHRDLKPTNVLVTVKDDRPMPKVIDFGVAKATQARLTEKTLFTRFQQWIGTPAYMSPEQAGLASFDVDTRSDVYSLGVLLYELLTGRTPFDTQKLMQAGYDAVMRTIREEEPPKPSTRLSTLAEAELQAVATQRGAEPAKLNRLVRGDLDWIVMKALEKDRTRRYETASALAQEVNRFLHHEPVSAAAPSAFYRAQRFVLRNRMAVGFSVALALSLFSGALFTTWQAWRATVASREADKQRATATNEAARAIRFAEESSLARKNVEANAYASQVTLAERHWEQGDIAAAEAALNSCPQELRHWEWNYLKRQCHSERVRFEIGFKLSPGDLAAQFSIQFVADSKSLAVAGPGVGLSLFDPADGRQVERTLMGMEKPPLDFSEFGAFSQDGRYFYLPWTGTNSPPVVMDLLTQQRIVLPDLKLRLLSADGNSLIAALTNQVQFYALPTGKLQRSVDLADRFEIQALSSDANRILLRWPDKLATYDRAQNALLEFPDSNHKSIEGWYPCSQAAFDSKAKRVAVTWVPARNEIPRDSRTEVELWEVNPPRRLWRVVLPGILQGPVFCLNDQSLVLAGMGLAKVGEVGSDFHLPDLAVLRSESGELVRLEQTDNASAHSGRYLGWGFAPEASGEGELFGVAAVPSPDQRTLALAAGDRTIHLLDLESGRQRVLRGHADLVSSLSFSPDGKRLASIDRRGEVRIWDAETTEAFEPESWSPNKGFRLSHNGRTVLWWTHFPEETARVLDLEKATLVEGPKAWTETTLGPDGTWLLEGNRERRVADGSIIRHRGGTDPSSPAKWGIVSEDGRVIVRADSVSGQVEVWDAISNDPASTIIRFEGPWENYLDWIVGGGGTKSEPERNLALSADGEYLALLHRPDEIRIYRIPLPGKEAVEQCRFSGSPPLAFGPDNVWILSGKGSKGVQKVALDSGKVLQTLLLNQTPVRGWEISRNGRLAICYAEGLPLLDLESGQIIPTGGGFQHEFRNPQASFSTDGARLAFPGNDRRLKVWNTATLSLVTSLDLPASQVCFWPDGHHLTVISPEGSMRVLDGTPWRIPGRLADLRHVTRTRVREE